MVTHNSSCSSPQDPWTYLSSGKVQVGLSLDFLTAKSFTFLGGRIPGCTQCQAIVKHGYDGQILGRAASPAMVPQPRHAFLSALYLLILSQLSRSSQSQEWNQETHTQRSYYKKGCIRCMTLQCMVAFLSGLRRDVNENKPVLPCCFSGFHTCIPASQIPGSDKTMAESVCISWC